MADWDINTADDVAQALDWLRRRMKGRGLLIVAIGVNSIAYSKEADVNPDDAADLIESELPSLRAGFAKLQQQKVTRGFTPRR